ncbi:MAG: UDP-2,3-diacylglucosamine diphosphatase LpxI [Planctomycetaceae bacterium]|nr:UDP-2,3-diacylglucosamine diphosphatase LpxI [Planctomycetaceae bacterium]
MKRVGIIAGFGSYPVLLARFLKQRNCEVYCLGVRDQADIAIKEYCRDYLWMGFGQFGKAVRFFKKHGVTQATMAGGIAKRQFHRPWLIWRYLPDFYTIRLFAPHFVFRTKNNTSDSLLFTCVEAFERQGITILPGTDLAPEMLVKHELLTRHGPTKSQWKDIQFGWKIAKEMGRMDIGQTVTVKDQSVIAVEALEGTDDCILRSGKLCPGFTVLKVAKPQQDMRFDLPSFGLQTVKTLVAAGGKVFVVEADLTVILGREEVIDFANKNGIVIVALTQDDLSRDEYDSGCRLEGIGDRGFF